MDAAELVNVFIQRVVVKEKQARYTGFVGSSKNRKKFLEALDHKLSSEIDLSKTTKSLDGKEWRTAAVLYSSNGTFGMTFNSLKEAYEQASSYGGWLILGLSGHVAIFRPEGKNDDELYFKL
jgi:hypothetical protein